MTDNPAAIAGLRQVIGILNLFEPLLANIKGDIRMILGNVAQMIGHRSANIQLWIVLEFLKQRQRKGRGFDKLTKPHCPRKPWPCSFTDESAHVGIGVFGPGRQRVEALRTIFDQEWPHAEFRRESLSEFVVGPHSTVESRNTPGCYQLSVRQVEKGSQPVILGRFERRPQRLHEKWCEFVEIRRQLFDQRTCDVLSPIFQFEFLQPLDRTRLKPFYIKAGHNVREGFADQIHQASIHHLLQRHSMLNC